MSKFTEKKGLLTFYSGLEEDVANAKFIVNNVWNTIEKFWMNSFLASCKIH